MGHSPTTQQPLPRPAQATMALTPFRLLHEPAPRPAWKRWLHIGESDKARQALERLLAQSAPTAPDATALSGIVSNFGLGGRGARELMREAFALALRHAVRDEHIDPMEAAYLQRLKGALGISDKELEKLQDEVIHPIYRKAVGTAIADDQLSASDRARLDRVMQDLRLAPTVARQLYDEAASERINSALGAAVADGRLAPAEEASLQDLARNLGASLNVDAATRATFDRMRLLWRVENGQLPVVSAPINLQRGESCHAAIHAVWNEPRTRTRTVGYHGLSTSIRICKGVRYRIGNVKPVRVTREEIVRIDEGTLYVTNKRVIFVGSKKNITLRLSSLLGFTPYSDGLELEKASGRPPLLSLSGGDVEVFHAIVSAALAAA